MSEIKWTLRETLEKQVDKVMKKVLEAFMLLERVLLKMRKAEHPQYWNLASAEEKKREKDKNKREVLKLNLKRRWLRGWMGKLMDVVEELK